MVAGWLLFAPTTEHTQLVKTALKEGQYGTVTINRSHGGGVIQAQGCATEQVGELRVKTK